VSFVSSIGVNRQIVVGRKVHIFNFVISYGYACVYIITFSWL